MAANEILPFASVDTGTNLETQAAYAAASDRTNGNQPGVARSKLVNKALRQVSAISAGVAQYLADLQASNVTDSLTPAQLAAMLKAAIGRGLVLRQAYVTPGSGAFVVPAGIYALFYRVWGAGGGGGAGGPTQAGNGGGSGGYSEGWLSVTPGQSLTWLVGQAGAAGANVGLGGGNGGSSAFNGSIVGSGGTGGAGNGTGGGTAGAASGGDLNIAGGFGTGPSIANSAGSLSYAPPGGGAPFSGATIGGYGTGIGTPGRNPGGGGSGGAGGSAGSYAGGIGGPGAVYIWG